MARKAPLPTVFVDSNILISALVAPASPAGVLVLWSSLRERLYAIVIAEFVRLEVEQALASRSTDLVALFRAQLALVRPLGVRLPRPDEVAAVRGKIRHLHDEPVLASALIARPTVIVSDNTKDFNAKVASAVGIPVMTSKHFMRRMAALPFGGLQPPG